MRREFTEDGWRFRVTKYRSTGRVLVQFYDDTLLDPAVEDVHRVEVQDPKRVEERETWSFGPLSGSKHVEIPYEDDEEKVEAAMEQAWSKIESIDENPSETFDSAVRNARGTYD